MNSYLIIKVEGKIIEKFILRCKKNNINLLKIERISNKEIIIKEQHNCRYTDYWEKQNNNFLLLAHEYIFVFQK